MNGSNARPKPSNDEDDEMEGIEGMDEDDDEDDFELDEDMAMFDAEADSEESSEDSQEDEEDEDDDESSLSDEQEGSLQDSDQDALEDEDEEERSLFDSDSRPTKSRKKFTSPLDDGFFSLQDFNAETEEGESRKASRGNLNEEEDDEDEESVDLFASVENEGVDFEEEDVEDTPAGEGPTRSNSTLCSYQFLRPGKVQRLLCTSPKERSSRERRAFRACKARQGQIQ
jgi:U3 small nucleolar RNA-associated protein MPP10